jgi:very-short-patch-repair endonuclease
MTELEATFAGQLQILGVPTPEREYHFARHQARQWRFDFAWPERKIAVEVEGGTWTGGAHTRGAHFESDAEKYNAAAALGWRVLRFTTDMVDDWRGARQTAQLLGVEVPAR